MKDLKIIIVCLLLNFICFAGIYAQQVKNTMSLLTQNEWTIVHNLGKTDSVVSVLNFTQAEYTQRNSYHESQMGFTAKYYLSNQPETIFDYDKVGKISNGRYIITLNKDSIIIREIIKISDTELEYTIVNMDKQTRSPEDQKKFAYRVKPK